MIGHGSTQPPLTEIPPPWIGDSSAGNAPAPITLTAAEAKERVFAHWDDLDRLCRRRFRHSENLAHEGLLYVLEQLQQDAWQRVRTWQGEGRFLTYLATLAARLLTDFSRKKFGHVRMPPWLAGKQDPLWAIAYRLLIVEHYQRREVVNLLLTNHPDREPWFLEEMVGVIAGRCPPNSGAVEPTVSMEATAEPPDAPAEDAAAGSQQENLMAALSQFLDSSEPPAAPMLAHIRALTERLRPHLQISAEDRLLLRMKFVDGLKMPEIVQALKLAGDPYKRYHKLLANLRAACVQAGLEV